MVSAFEAAVWAFLEAASAGAAGSEVTAPRASLMARRMSFCAFHWLCLVCSPNHANFPSASTWHAFSQTKKMVTPMMVASMRLATDELRCSGSNPITMIGAVKHAMYDW